MSIHILGNGPSINLFHKNQWPQSDIYIGCNFSSPRLKPDYVIILDARPIQYIIDGHKIEYPVIISDVSYRHFAKKLYAFKKKPEDYLNIIQTIPRLKYEDISNDINLSSGHMAVITALEKHSERTRDPFHIWGIDSMWSSDILSTTDLIVDREHQKIYHRDNLTRVWTEQWKRLFTLNPERNFIIHSPSHAILKIPVESFNNVTLHKH